MNTFEKAYQKRLVYISYRISKRAWWNKLRLQVISMILLSEYQPVETIDQADYIFMIPGWRNDDLCEKEFKIAAEREYTCLNSGLTAWLFDIRKMMYQSDRESEEMCTMRMIDDMYKK
jgi:hypothetical protein